MAQNARGRGTLKDVNNKGSPSGTQQGRKPRLDDPTVDIGALMRRALQAPKLRGGASDTPSASQSQPVVAPQQKPPADTIPFRMNPAYSPDDSLAKAATKLASIKAAGNPLNKSSKAPPNHTPEPQQSSSPQQARKPTKQDQTPGYQPSNKAAIAAVPLAAGTLISKRNRRKSVYQKPARYGDWFTGDDNELDEMVDEHNEEEKQAAEEAAAKEAAAEAERQKKAEKAAKVARRKSAFPALGRSTSNAAALVESDTVAATEHPQEEETQKAEQPKKASEDVGQQVRDIANDLCAKLDGLIEPELSPTIKGGRKKAMEDDKSLREKLLESWEGKSYYDRLLEIAATPARGGSRQQHLQPTLEEETAPKQAAGSKQPKEITLADAAAVAAVLNKPPPPAAQPKESSPEKQQPPAISSAAQKPAGFNLKIDVPKAQQAQQQQQRQGGAILGLSARGSKPGPAPWQAVKDGSSGEESSPGVKNQKPVAAQNKSNDHNTAIIEKLQEELDATKSEKESLEQQVQALKAEIEAQKDAIETLKDDVEQEQCLHKAEKQRREAAERHCQDLQTMLKEADGKGNHAEAQFKKFKEAAINISDVEGRLGLAEVQASSLLEAATSLMEHVMKAKTEAQGALDAVNAGLNTGNEEQGDSGGRKTHRTRRKSTWR